MSEVSSWPAPGKLNLFLHVTGRRADGYHDLQTLFQLLDWGDELHLETTDDPAIERLRPIPGVSEAADLSLRAARLLQGHCGVRRGARLRLDKHIPQGSGLGGASSDAATVLVALNHSWGCGLSTDELAGLGVGLGADVPVFVRGRSAWAEGVGERLTPLVLGERHYVLVMPAFGVSTAEVFADPELHRDSEVLSCPEGGDLADIADAAWRNDCEPAALRRSPRLARLAAELREFGPARMSGTGSTFFFEVAGAREAEWLTARLKSRYNHDLAAVRWVRGVDRSPLLHRLETA
jgi:4-diphosphocytidyl-2-C-methyl-D-erythritol kinase